MKILILKISVRLLYLIRKDNLKEIIKKNILIVKTIINFFNNHLMINFNLDVNFKLN